MKIHDVDATDFVRQRAIEYAEQGIDWRIARKRAFKDARDAGFKI